MSNVNEILEEVLRVVGELVLQLAFRIPGVLLLSCCGQTPQGDPHGCLEIIIGGLFWMLVGLTIWGVFLLR